MVTPSILTLPHLIKWVLVDDSLGLYKKRAKEKKNGPEPGIEPGTSRSDALGVP
jgi:hypothetical protein